MSVRLTVDLSDEVNGVLSEIAAQNGITKAEAMRRAFAILAVAEREKKKGIVLGLLKENKADGYDIVGRLLGY